MSTYSEKLKHPKWQKKRLEILQRDDFKCQLCKCEDKTLHIHHLTYDNVDPWEYDEIYLITLCHNCHEKEEFLKPFTADSVEYLTTIGLLRTHISQITMTISNRLDSMDSKERQVYLNNILKSIKNV